MTVVMVLVVWVLISFALTFVWVVCRRLVGTNHVERFDQVPLERSPSERVPH